MGRKDKKDERKMIAEARNAQALKQAQMIGYAEGQENAEEKTKKLGKRVKRLQKDLAITVQTNEQKTLQIKYLETVLAALTAPRK
ncbi:hypothetical protein HDU93_000833 [Gonapodya sp. JEL0774]|nr:hypothetical protein HDU93_000833 [Gonapodya sp. JEL0774]